MKKLVLWITVVAVLIVLVTLIFLRVFGWNKGEVVVQNHAAESVTSCELIVSGQHFNLGAIPPNASRYVRFRVQGESDYALTVHFESGRTLTKTVGYVDIGFNADDSISINADDIVLDSRQGKKPAHP